MSEQQTVLEYKCPCCDSSLIFDQQSQKLQCNACDNEYELEAVKEYRATMGQDEFQWDPEETAALSDDELSDMQTFLCPACSGEILSDANTAATFCPFCENPAILPGRVSGGLKPDGVLPFQKSKKEAQDAFLQLCKGKPLLPKEYMASHRIEKITGMYIPFWLYSCGGDVDRKYHATRVRHWSDANYHYTKTSYFLVSRGARADFTGIPMDAAGKIDNALMESIEPFDYSQIVDFDTAYLSGFFADKFDVPAASGESRICQRVENTLDSMITPSLVGYTTAIPHQSQRRIHHSKAKYVLLPVWMLHTKYKDKTYVFAMNGQTGRMTGTFPVCPKRSAAWFSGIFAAVAVLATLIQYLVV